MLRRRATGGIDHGRAAALPCTIASPAPPKLFLAWSDEASPERAEGVMSPTSILQAANLTSSATCVHGGATSRGGNGHHRPWEGKPVGLGLVGALNGEAPGASWEFGVTSRSGAAGGDPALADSRRRCMSPREMEMSEDYTCVIARGPNPRTTHIFDNRVVDVESRGGFSSASAGTNDFLRYCHGCNKDIGQGKDIYMYRGEKAFCSRECRYQDMLFDGGMEEL